MARAVTTPNSEADEQPERSPRRSWIVGVGLALVVACALGVRWRLLDFPLERDEGEYAYNAQLLLDGVPPYRLAYASQKLPGSYFACAAALAVWPQLPHGLHFGLALANALSTLLLFVLVRRLFDDRAALAASAAFALLAVGAGVLGFAAHATHFVVTAVLAGLVVLLPALERACAMRRLALAGLCFGAAILVRQPAAAFALLGALLTLVSDRVARLPWKSSAQRVGLFSLAVIAPYGALCAWLALNGDFARFWFWTVTYATQYGSLMDATQAWRNLTDMLPVVVGPNLALWLVGGLGALILIAQRTRGAAVAALWLIAAALATAAGFYFRNHYFVQLLPVVATLFGVACAGPRAPTTLRRQWRRAAAVVAPLVLGVCVWQQREYLFTTPTRELCRSIYLGNPFLEVEAIARAIRERSRPADTIAVIGSEAQLYAYAHRRAATGFLYTYALMEPTPFAARFQAEMIAEIETARPRYVVVVDSTMSWLPRKESSPRILEWARAYTTSHYQLIGLMPQGGELVLDEAARAHPVVRDHPQLLVYERR